MTATTILFWILVWHLAHWVADFLLQIEYMALNKSKSLKALGLHVGTYSGVVFMALITAALVQGLGSASVLGGIVFYSVLTGGLHFATDYVTSRIAGHYRAKGDMGNFFNTIGADQAIHHALAAVLAYFIFAF